MENEHLRPGLHGPSLRWYTPKGVAYWALRSTVRYWITGRPVFGRGDNATFLHDATADYRGGPVEKLTRARWRRLARRWGAVGLPVLLWTWSCWAVLVYLVVALAGGGWLLWRAVAAWWPHRENVREFVLPTWAVVAKVLGEKYSRRAALRAVELPPGFGWEDAGETDLMVRIHLPLVPLDDGIKKRLVSSAAERLGIADPAASWMVKGTRAHVDISPRKLPPRTLTYSEVRTLVLDASERKPFLGLAAGRTPVYADLDNDGPHVGISAGTGAGKSTLLRLMLARRVLAGVGLVVCDYKVTSHPWARRIAQADSSRCIYVTDEPEISEAILAVFAEFMRRREVLKTRPDELDTFRPIDLLVEELNSLASRLRTWWGHERRRIIQDAKDHEEPVPYVPVVPEAVDALGQLVQMGRELRVHVHVAAQRLDASILAPKDGGAVRESFQNRFLAKYTKKAWDMLCGGIPFQAFPGGPRGVWAAVVNGEVTFFRVPFMTDQEAYCLAMSGEAPTGPVLGGRTYVRRLERLVTLAEAVEILPARPSLDALRKRVQRAELTAVGRRGNADQFDLADLERLFAMS
jgi:hypothetical protein